MPPKRSAKWDAGRRRRLRERYSIRVLGLVEKLLAEHRDAVVPGSQLGKALQYLRGQWSKLIRYVENGDWPISNNLCENAIRPFVVGRGGWLFSDTVDGANASANLYSLVETCKANRIDPYRYLTWLFRQLPPAKDRRRLRCAPALEHARRTPLNLAHHGPTPRPVRL
jgi:transposase